MFTSTLLSAAAFTGLALAAPVSEEKRAADINTVVLQFALTLEHLESVFYDQALQKFSQEDFQKSGYSADYYNNLHYIAYDEQVHVQTLEAALTAAGVTPNAACTYSFNYSTVPEFITLSSVIESVGTSAYLGAAPLITESSYLTVAGAILATEALHTSMQRLAIGEVPMAKPFETPLDPTSAYTIAASFIKSCPSSNTALPFTAFPSLAADGKDCRCEEPDCGNPSVYVKRNGWPGNGWGNSGQSECKPPSPGDTVSFTAAGKIPAGSYVTFINGLTVTSVKGDVSGKTISAAIPSGENPPFGGQTYAFVTKSDVEATFNDSQVLYGPAIIEVNPPAPQIDYAEALG